MTYTSRELAALGVDPIAIAFRRWRRRHRITLDEAARLLDVRPQTLLRFELGIARRSLVGMPQRMQNLMTYWRESMRAAVTRPKRKRGRKPKLKPLVKCEP